MKAQRILLLAVLLTGFGVATAQAQLPVRWNPPAGVVQISPCVPGQGFHFANPADLPNGGPIYVVLDGRLLAVEYEFDLEDHGSFHDLSFRLRRRELPIHHADIDFLPEGHPGFEHPHYALHFWLVPHDLHEGIDCQ